MLNYANKFLDIVIVDATYKRNRFNMPLINIIGVNNYGRTILLGFGLMDDEKMDSYDWFFKSIKNIWKKEPKFFISDECNEIISGKLIHNFINTLGIKNNFKSKRLICAWHLQRNLASKFASLSKKNKELYQKIINLPFTLFETDFNDIVKELKKDGVISEDQLKYLDLKLKTKTSWAKCFIKKDFVAGICTTSRVEALHSVLLDYLTSNSRLSEVLQAFRKIESTQIEKFNKEFEMAKGKNPKKFYNGYLIKELRNKITPYAVKKVEERLNFAISYQVEELNNSNKW